MSFDPADLGRESGVFYAILIINIFWTILLHIHLLHIVRLGTLLFCI